MPMEGDRKPAMCVESEKLRTTANRSASTLLLKPDDLIHEIYSVSLSGEIKVHSPEPCL
jgi:hypothetical protein